MGSWQYYIIKMTMSDLSANVKFGSEIHDDRTLDEAIQRVLDETRVKRGLIQYLTNNKDRFFSSLVIAAFGGEPQWYPLDIAEDPKLEIFANNNALADTFGVLTFTGKQQYYALDGQHRLKAIKSVLENKGDLAVAIPPGFKDEEISVILVIPENVADVTDRTESMIRYRRLFGHLNRYAKATDKVTNIIMDEDDGFAILTRRLIAEHHFFTAPGPHKDSHRVKTTKGKPLKPQDSYYTSLESLYDYNIALLSSQARENLGWNDHSLTKKDIEQHRPSDEWLDKHFLELVMYWDGLITTLPDLQNEPSTMRTHSPDDEDAIDSALFWPIGQEIMIRLARRLLDLNLPDPNAPTPDDVVEALRPLRSVSWSLFDAPWRNMLLVKSPKWKMRSDDQRKEAINLCVEVLYWLLGLNILNDSEAAALKARAYLLLVPSGDSKNADHAEWWSEVEALAAKSLE